MANNTNTDTDDILTPPAPKPGGLLSKLRAKTALLPAGDYVCRLAPGSAKEMAGGKGEGVTFRVEVLEGPHAGRSLELSLRTSWSPLPAVAEKETRLLVDMAERLGVDGETEVEIVDAIAARLFRTKKNPNPARLILKIGARPGRGGLTYYAIDEAKIEDGEG